MVVLLAAEHKTQKVLDVSQRPSPPNKSCHMKHIDTIHFVYAGDPGDTRIQAPYSITRNIYNYLVSVGGPLGTRVAYYQWDSKQTINLGPNDILLGHPNYDPDTVVQRVFKSGQRGAGRYLIHPFHTKRVEDNFPFHEMAMASDGVFAICGPHWIKTRHTTPFHEWPIIHLNMAIDIDYFRFRRTSFKQQFNRRFVYVGSSMPQKNLDVMAETFAMVPKMGLDWYGGHHDHKLSSLPNVRTFGWDVLTQERLDTMVAQCDFFVSTSVSDASPTALIEAAAIGMPVLCTHGSGFDADDSLVYYASLSPTSAEHNAVMLDAVQRISEDDLLQIAGMARITVEDRHNWGVFLGTLGKHIWGD